MKKRALFVFLILHLIFIGVSLYEFADHSIKAVFLLFIALTLLFFYYRTYRIDTKSSEWNIGPEVIFCIAGAVLTFFLQTEFQVSAFMAASVVGLAGSFLPSLAKDDSNFKNLSPAIYCGAFVGMTSGHLSNYTFIILAATVAGLILTVSKNTFIGMGGKLGSVAFGGVVLIFALKSIL